MQVQLFVIPWTAAHQASLSFTISWSLLKLMSIESMMPSNHLILCCPLLLQPSIFPSIEFFSVGCTIVYSTSIEWKYSVTNRMCCYTSVVAMLFNFCRFKGGKWYAGIVLVFISLIMIEVDHIFMCLRTI